MHISKKLLDVKIDYVFKKIFGRKGNEDITKAFLSTILEDKITSISLDKNTILEKDFKEDKIGVVDISTVINGYINADIEMQVVNNKDIEKRILWYWSKLYSNGIKKGENYKILHRTIVILITNYELDVTKEIEKYFTKWSIREAEYTNVILTKDLEFFIIELPKLRKNKTNTKLDKWVNFIERPSQVDIMNEEDEALKKAREILEDMSKDEHERYIASLREKYILDQNSIRETGIEEGIKQGIKQGIEKRNTEMILKMKSMNMKIEQIAEITGLTKDEIEKID